MKILGIFTWWQTEGKTPTLSLLSRLVMIHLKRPETSTKSLKIVFGFFLAKSDLFDLR